MKGFTALMKKILEQNIIRKIFHSLLNKIVKAIFNNIRAKKLKPFKDKFIIKMLFDWNSNETSHISI